MAAQLQVESWLVYDTNACQIRRRKLRGDSMRYRSPGGKLRLFAIAGTRAVMMALDLDNDLRPGLRGFAFKRETPEISGGEASGFVQARFSSPSILTLRKK